ncbi:hypothetical protein BDE02_04G100700 [Populus trichocarpa]|nr:hypothetical protein BDE02_04G100700 [Populus trichocarpa]
MTRWASGALDPKISTSGDVVTSVKRGVWAVIADLQFFLVIACRPPRRRTTRQLLLFLGEREREREKIFLARW